MSNLPISKCLSWFGVSALAISVVFGFDLSIAAAAADHAAESTVNTFISDEKGGGGKGAAFVFWIFALSSLGGAIFVITRNNMVTAVMGMVGTFFAIAGLYLMLYASFLAVMQVLVYAGAIMVLFVFVIMILNRPEDEPWVMHGILGKGVAALGLLYLFKRLAGILWEVKDVQPLVLDKAALNVDVVLNHSDPALAAGAVEAITRTYEFGSVEGVGYTLFSKYLFPFEAVSIVLLVAVVGAIAIARPTEEESAEDAAEAEAAKEAS
ncbi:MAG: NADH-quinone oxidoreductase subunit J [Myxococcales bacterium]|nr:NADH-quinone oxidoreductase subunit J [Myxococcales bacterium]